MASNNNELGEHKKIYCTNIKTVKGFCGKKNTN